MRQLIAAVHQVVPGRKPHGDALAHGVRHADEVADHETRRPPAPARPRARTRCRAPCRRAPGTGRRTPAPGPCPSAGRKRPARAPRIPAPAACTRRGGISKWLVSARQRGARFARVAQHIPALGEIAGQEKHQQHADDLHRLKSEQVDLGVARAGTGAEQNQQRRKREAGQQRHEAQACRRAARNRAARRRPAAGSPASHALREIHEQQVVAHRIAQADHEDQARRR